MGSDLRSYRPPSRALRASERPRRAHALLLKVEDLLARGAEDEEVRAALAAVSEDLLTEAGLWVRKGLAELDLFDLDDAAASFERARGLDPRSADALHGLGCVAFERGDRDGFVPLFLEVRELDLAAPRPEWSLSLAAFEREVEHALEGLPPQVARLLAGVPILHEDYPDPAIIEDGFDPRLLGLFSGIPLPDKSFAAGGELGLDHVLLYQRNIERVVEGPEEAAEEIRITLLHEAGHFFGMSEEELDEIGLG